jgi:hypothetical protein
MLTVLSHFISFVFCVPSPPCFADSGPKEHEEFQKSPSRHKIVILDLWIIFSFTSIISLSLCMQFFYLFLFLRVLSSPFRLSIISFGCVLPMAAEKHARDLKVTVIILQHRAVRREKYYTSAPVMCIKDPVVPAAVWIRITSWLYNRETKRRPTTQMWPVKKSSPEVHII